MADPDSYDYSNINGMGGLESFLRGRAFQDLRDAKVPNGASDVDLHHVSTVSVAENSSFITDVYGREEYARKFVDGRSLIALPTDREGSTASGLAQHRGNHPGYREAEARVHAQLKAAYDTDLRDLRTELGRDPTTAEIDGLKAEYRSEFNRIELVLRDGHVASLHQGGNGEEWRPRFPIYGSDAHLDPTQMGWDRLREQVYNELTLETLRDESPWLHRDPNDPSRFLVSDEALDAEISRREGAGPDGNRVSGVERGIIRDDENIDRYLAQAGYGSRSEALAALNAEDTFGKQERFSTFDGLLRDLTDRGLLKAGAVSLALILAEGALSGGALAKTAVQEQIADGVDPDQARENVLSLALEAWENFITVENLTELALTIAVDLQQNGRLIASGGPEGVALVGIDIGLSSALGIVEIVKAIFILLEDPGEEGLLDWLIVGLDWVSNKLEERLQDIGEAKLSAEIAAGFSPANIAVSSGETILDFEGPEYLEDVHWGAAFEGSEIRAGGGDDVLAHFGYGELSGGFGEDIVVGVANELGPEGERVTLSGGADNDWVVSLLGEGAITAGGSGRDWIFNTSKNGIVYGDTESGLDDRNPGQQATGLDQSEVVDGIEIHSDNIWWWPSVTVMDPTPEDQLRFFGLPLVGGNNNLPGVSLGPLSQFGLGLAMHDSPLFFDFVLPFITYMFNLEEKTLYVGNIFNLLDDIIAIGGAT
ncbi:AHH domain-containing protein, partial [Jannaschia sp.]|nr:AHH domain-containing protein [Jannaschia sp.]